MGNDEPKKWPSDAVMLVCATPAEAIRDNMESVNDGACRDCGCAIVYDGKTMRVAMNAPERQGRPVRFFCIACAVQYDRQTITHFADHRGGRAAVPIRPGKPPAWPGR